MMRLLHLAVLAVAACPRAQSVAAPTTAVRSAVACKVFAIERQPAEAGLTLAPLREVGRTGTGVAPLAIPAHWTWWVEPATPAEFDGKALTTLVRDLEDAALPALSLAGCTHLADRDVAPLARLRALRQLDLSGCVALTTAALAAVDELPALAWLRTDGTRIDAAAVRARMTRRVDECVARGMAAQGLVGVAVAVVVDGRLAHAQGYGHADREAGVAVCPTTTLFRWASISKPVTGVVALQLVEQEKLDLDADVRALVPEFPAKPHVITARHLLCHQGGIVHYRNGPVIKTERSYDVEHPFVDLVLALDTFKESPLVCEPGSKHSYTTHGFILLGAVVQRAAGEAFWQQVKARIAGPLGMTTFQPDFEWEAVPGRTQGYRRVDGAIVRSADEDVSWKLPGGGFTSSVVDLARFGQGLLRGSLLRPTTQAAMFTRQATSGGVLTGYGLGIAVGEEHGVACVNHSGAQGKTRTKLTLFPTRQVAVAVMTNTEWAQVLDLARDVARIALEQ